LAAAADADEAAEDAESAADVAGVAPEVDEPLGELPEALDVVLEEEDVEEGVGDGVAAGTVDTPYKHPNISTCQIELLADHGK
jgi:hypothetical protein